ncbi:dermonecrotic toxin domain-containing protein [Pseudomonas sp. AMR01]|uniref:dermonecrotic toxin domain-containing protein n=1 Tax=Pseudomonas sp. AMR01 TaxID=3064904 RepID=UPI0035BEE7AF
MSKPSARHRHRRPDSHYHHLNNAIPAWLGKASNAKRQAFSSAKLQPVEASTALKGLNADHWTAQNAVDNALKHIKNPQAFAREVLENALLTRYGLSLDSEAVHLRLYIALNVPWFSIPSGAARTWTVSLLDAALHNFEHAETLEGAFEAGSTFITRPSPSGQFETLPTIGQTITVNAFTTLCRELDIGARYQRYLNEQLGMTEPVSAAVLRRKVDASGKAALRAALQLARLRGDIGDDYARQIEGLLEGRRDLERANLPLRCHDLKMMDAPLSGILLLAPDLENTRSVQRLVAYVPDDPAHPLKEYASPLAFKQALTQQLRDDDYQVFFSRFVAHEHRGQFFANLSQRLARITWHPPVHGSGQAPWRKEPTDDPKLQFAASVIQGDVWQHLYQQKLNQVLNDARTQAVATADVDRNARWALWDSFVNVASSILNAAVQIVAPFIPGLGELMLGYMAYQLLDDVFEGIIDWAEGETREAFAHLMGVLQSLVELGAFGAGSTIGVAELRKALPSDVVAFFDRFKPVTLANGNNRYWKPDLTPYEQPLTLPPRMGISEHGLHTVRGESILPLEGTLYAVEKIDNSAHYRIKHPTRADAYTPTVRHNGSGAWHTELERPLQWDRPTLLQRLGHKAQGLNEADRELALNISGVQENALRKMHVDSQPIPPLLDDTLARLRIDRDLQRLIDNLRSDDPALYQSIDPQDQLQLLTTYGNWPAGKSLRFLNKQGEVTWTFGDPTKPVVQIHEAQLSNGELLKTVLQSLTEDELRIQFDERIGDPQLSLDVRTRHLREKLAQSVERQRAGLFDSRYAPLTLASTADTRQLLQTAPGLPVSVAQRLSEQASGAELDVLDQHSTPPRLAELARAALEEVQLSRAYEGQHLSSPQTLDTDRLALSSLILQPGWSDQVQLEARHRSVDGALWNAVGPADAAIRRTLVRLGSGRYVAYEGGAALCGEIDLYAAILHALPDAQRNALGIDIHAGPELRRRLADRPLARETLRVLLDAPAPESVRVETLRLLGNTVGYAGEPPTAAQPLSLGQRIRALFPILDEQQAQQMIDAMAPGSADVAVAALETIHLQLQSTLATWQNDIPTHHPTFGTELAARQRRYELRNRRLIVEQIQQCWRRETDADNHYGDHTRDGFTLQLRWPIMGDLPPLATEFAHVSFLSLLGAESTSGTARFIEHFPRLRHLEIRETPLGELPASISAMPALRNLSLDNCNVVLTPQGAARLAAMSRLENLNLHQNPLGQLPDVQSMSDLEALDLSRTGIDQLPAGLLNLPRLRTAFLSGNRLRELPPALFELSPSSSQRFDFSGNPLAQPTLERIKAYYQQHSTYWEADAAPVDQRDTRLLFPSMNNDSVNKFIFSLPGDIEAGRRELARLAQELGTLQTQLSAWSTETGLADLEQARRQALHQLLERSWRRETPQGTQFIHSLMIPRAMAGDLPTLSAQFKHIGYLSLEGNGGPMQVNTFIQSFAALDILNIQDARLGDIPAKVFDAPTLTHLSLPRCGITLTDASQTALQGMTRLQHLDLGENPLGRAVDFRQLVNLQEVSLQHTGLTQAPAGLLTQNRSMSINLSRNAIQELPDAIFTLPATLTHRLDLYANPLSSRSLNQIKAYCQRTGEFFNAQTPAAERERVEALYPFLLENEADRFIFRLPGDMSDVAGHVTRLEAEYQQLGIDLDQWILDVPERHPLLDLPLDEHTRAQEQLHRRDFKTLLEQAWRRETAEDEESLDDELTHSLSIDTPIMGALPQLSARIEHISRFEFLGNGTTTAVDGTLQCFPNLQTLNVQRCSLRALPRSLFSMPRLCSVELNYCEITLTEDAARSVNDLSAMEFLDLSNNPLTLAPDVSGIQSLIALHLRNTQITRVPPGVFQLSELQVLDLSSNQITEIPADLLEMTPSLNEDSDLSANPLSAQSLAYLRTYFQRTGNDFEVPGATWDEQGNALPQPFPHPQEE